MSDNDRKVDPPPGSFPTSKEDLLQFVESTRDFVIALLDSGGHVRTWNEAGEHIHGYRESEVIGRHFSMFFTAEDLQSGKPEFELQEAAERGTALDENWLTRKDGRHFYASGLTTALHKDGAVSGYVKIYRDLTERKRLDDESKIRAAALAEADRCKDEFLAILSHELRNPLAPIMNALHILQQSGDTDPMQVQARQLIARQARQMTRLIDDLLDVTRITRGKLQLRKEIVDLTEILHAAVETAKPQIESRRHELFIDQPQEPVWLDADAGRLEQVVMNLLVNAAKYTEPGGSIRLRAAVQPEHIVIEVHDEGDGIAPELLPHIFDLYIQADRTLSRSHGGLGIGLALAKSIVEMHGGSITAHSDGPGLGSTFRLTLPTVAAPLATSITPPSIAKQARPPGKVLIVDDNHDAADSLSILLTLQGYQTLIVHDGLTAIDCVPDFNPDVIFLDIGLPGADGYEVAQQVRGNNNLRNVVLIAMTGYGYESDRVKSQQAGFDHHLVKPADPEKIQELLNNLPS